MSLWAGNFHNFPMVDVVWYCTVSLSIFPTFCFLPRWLKASALEKYCWKILREICQSLDPLLFQFFLLLSRDQKLRAWLLLPCLLLLLSGPGRHRLLKECFIGWFKEVPVHTRIIGPWQGCEINRLFHNSGQVIRICPKLPCPIYSLAALNPGE